MRAGLRLAVRSAGRHDRGERVLRPALAESGEEGENEKREARLDSLFVRVDREMDQPTADGEGDRHGEDAAEHRPEAAEEERVRTADVVLELEHAAVDPLDHADDGAEGACYEGRDG